MKRLMFGLSYVKISIIFAVIALVGASAFLVINLLEDQWKRFEDREIGDSVVEYEGSEYVLKNNIERCEKKLQLQQIPWLQPWAAQS